MRYVPHSSATAGYVEAGVYGATGRGVCITLHPRHWMEGCYNYNPMRIPNGVKLCKLNIVM
jgi:hypothetical protein